MFTYLLLLSHRVAGNQLTCDVMECAALFNVKIYTVILPVTSCVQHAENYKNQPIFDIARADIKRMPTLDTLYPC